MGKGSSSGSSKKELPSGSSGSDFLPSGEDNQKTQEAVSQKLMRALITQLNGVKKTVVNTWPLKLSM